MRKQLFALAAVAALAAPQFAAAQDSGSWLVRARALYLQSENHDTTGLDLSVNDKAFPEFDVSYFFTPNIAAELILTYPQYHKIEAGGTKIGGLRHLPPTLTAQYHFTNFQGFRPYLGAGVNYTNVTSVSWEPAVEAALHPSITRNSFGWAVQAGVDIPVGNNWLVNVDVKKVKIGVDVKSSGTKVGEFDIDPLLFSVGVGYRF
ncbi:OmpW family protein [Ideonella sp. B508-1]|uniref:OmpW/AlkL family protein n=1 Tax=Ideonella sp. B508-1 TaxID=137716 RepID=UPI0003453A46|nr:OmpW family outer membrane protein [Ideonella sp. B508-1]